MCTSTSPQCSYTTRSTQDKCLIRLQHQSFAWFVVSIRESFNGIGTAVFRMFTTTGYFFAASSYTKVHTKSMFTARKQSCGKVMFSQVCVSVHRGWGWVLPRGGYSRGWVLIPLPDTWVTIGYGQQTGGTHGTGMLSCVLCNWWDKFNSD